ncbi:MAG TPA: zinc-dependent metalloprotease, partial [Bacteroidota bacterium]|nr:zinc-dependent metalloprotease [Bacteroidota bacterium]
VLLFVLLASGRLEAQEKPASPFPTIDTRTAGLQKLPGYFNLYWDAHAGTLWLEIDKMEQEFLYVSSLKTGVGSNDIGLDRGQLGGTHVVRFTRSGPKILMVEPNQNYRALSNNPDERSSVEEAFAQSILWGFVVVAEEGERVLVDATPFFLRDAHDVAGTLKRTGQGNFKLEASRCALYLAMTKNFPRNTEVEATLTFTGDDPGNWLQSVVPTPQAVTVREHHSFVQLPDSDYTPRGFDPRAGFFPVSYFDFAAPIDQPINKQFITRHRLKKKDPAAQISDPVEPIVYYVDRGAPEPIRSALIEGASWWNQAFTAAGYRNAFQVRLMPEGADPMDVRYNVIQWVHRSTRGWSYGGGVNDPRTGEIIQGHVTLGSLRVRQDYLIAEGLLAHYGNNTPYDSSMVKMALARIRQLAAHEVGHTLGLAHNYIASTENRASVMDYPAPLVKIKDGNELDVSDAYAVGIGEWDKVAIAYGYQDFPAGTDEKSALNSIVTSAASHGLIFLTDEDARPEGSAHPRTHLWDNGVDAVDELNRMMQVRSIALNGFSEDKIRQGVPMSSLEETLVPVYLAHRYQVEAASKVLGGLMYTYALRGDGQLITEIVSPKDQRRALDALLATITPKALVLPDRIVKLIPPRAFGYPRTRELFKSRTGLTFDPITAAETAAEITVSLLLNPERAARLVDYHARNEQNPGLEEVLDRLINATWKSHLSGYEAEVNRAVDDVVLRSMMALALKESASTQSRAIASLKVVELREWLTAQLRKEKDEEQRAHFQFGLSEINTFQERPADLKLTKPVVPPDGQPIGDG